ncbi:MAG: NAD-binding protein [Desulfobacterales bacterium]|nr:NAD-binding protein [Desulfobacterales bacterium]
MEKIWIIGAGQFGIRAAKWLAKQGRGESLTLVDLDSEGLAQAKDHGCKIVQADGIDYLYKQLSREKGPDWIVPAVPVHLAWEWCRLKLGDSRLVSFKLPQGFVDELPNAMQGDSGDIYVSHADFLCPPNCNEPDDYCTKTIEPRKQDMFELLEKKSYESIKAFVVRSMQLGPGVGGYRPNVLFDLVDGLACHQGPCFVATACRCHGVVTAGRIVFKNTPDAGS